MAAPSWIDWLDRHGHAMQGLAALMTAVIALAALIGVKVQIDAAARTQQEQSARDIYREFLNLSINKPEFADPDYCAIRGGPQEAAYHSYVDYLLYTSEQVLSVSPDWEGALASHLEAHGPYLCGAADWSHNTDAVQALVANVKARICTSAVTQCEETAEAASTQP